VADERKLDHDSSLVRAARDGDRVAFGQLYDRYAPTVHGILLARVPVDEVDDLVHDVFLRALPRLHTLRDPEGFGAAVGDRPQLCQRLPPAQSQRIDAGNSR